VPAQGPIVRLVLLTVLYFALLMALAATGFYPPLFRAGASALFGSLGSGRIAKFEPFQDPRGVFDTRMSVGTDSAGYPAFPSSLGVNSVRQGYVPIAVLVALMLATPIAWRRKWRALALGLLLVQGFVVLRVAVALLVGFSRVGLGGRRLLEVSPPVAWGLRRADQILAADLHTTYIAPLLIWALVVVWFRATGPPWGSEGTDATGAEPPRAV
jgi:hypothetical protein